MSAAILPFTRLRRPAPAEPHLVLCSPSLLSMVLALRRHQREHQDIWNDRERMLQPLADQIIDRAEFLVMQGDSAPEQRVVIYMKLCGGLIRRVNELHPNRPVCG